MRIGKGRMILWKRGEYEDKKEEREAGILWKRQEIGREKMKE